VHYVIPGILQQQSKKIEHGQAMEGFALNCVVAYNYSNYLEDKRQMGNS
jgi:hypothetical protein